MCTAEIYFIKHSGILNIITNVQDTNIKYFIIYSVLYLPLSGDIFNVALK